VKEGARKERQRTVTEYQVFFPQSLVTLKKQIIILKPAHERAGKEVQNGKRGFRVNK
jgi:hypothetical protein